MNATTVNQFATRANALAYAIETLGGNAERLRALALWMLKQASLRKAFDMDVREFMARCPAKVRDAAREVWINAQALLSTLQGESRAEVKAKAAPKALRKRKISAKRQAQLDAEYAAQQAEAELLARLPEAEAAAYLRETM